MTVLNAEYAGKSPTLPGFSNRDSVLLMELVEKGKTESKIQTSLSEFKRALSENRGVALFELHIKDDPKVRNVIVQQVRRNPNGEGIQALTLREVADAESIRVHVPIVSNGTPKASGAGTAILAQPVSHVRIRARVSHVPDSIAVDVSKLGLSERVVASQLSLPDGVELISDPETVLFELEVPMSTVRVM